MGQAYGARCPACGEYELLWLGCGMQHSSVQMGLKNQAIRGKLGHALQRIVAEHPNGQFDGEYAVYKCVCGGWTVERKLDYYIPNQEGQMLGHSFGAWPVWVATCIWRKKRKCPRCGKMMHAIPEHEVWERKLACVKCGAPMEVDTRATICWD